MLSKLVQMENLVISKLDWWPKSIPKYMVQMEKTVGCRWVHANKVGPNAEVNCLKARPKIYSPKGEK